MSITFVRKKKSIETEKNEKIYKRFKITQEMYEALETFLSSKVNRLSTLSQMRAYLTEKFELHNRRISLSTISKMLKRLSFSRKRTKKYVARRNIMSTLERRKAVAIEFLSHLKDNREIIFIDETGFNQSMISFYGYSKVGEKCLTMSSPKSENYTVISAITKGKILGYQLFKGGVTADDFGAFIALMLQKNPEILESRSQYIFFMDNAPIHRAKSLKPFFENFRILFNAPYSPFLNPIEEFFGNWKHNFRKKAFQNTVDIVDKKYFIHSFSFFKDCLKQKSNFSNILFHTS